MNNPTVAEIQRNYWITEQARLRRHLGRPAEWEVAGLYNYSAGFWAISLRMLIGVRANAGRFMINVRR